MRVFDPETGAETVRRVFDLAADPRETTSLSADFGAADPVVEEASGNHGRHYEPRFDELSSVRRAHLEALGYLR